MSIIASAPVPAGSNLASADTLTNLRTIPTQRTGTFQADAGTTNLAEWAASLLPRRVGYSTPPPCSITWCVGCVSPDPGVVDHYSREWTGEDRYDGARWQIQVTQRHTPDGIGPAVVDVNDAPGTYGSLTAFAADLIEADTLAKQINGTPAVAR